VSVLDRSAAAASVRASFGAQYVRAQTGMGIE
jgi:cation/acetate symporter